MVLRPRQSQRAVVVSEREPATEYGGVGGGGGGGEDGGRDGVKDRCGSMAAPAAGSLQELVPRAGGGRVLVQWSPGSASCTSQLASGELPLPLDRIAPAHPPPRRLLFMGS